MNVTLMDVGERGGEAQPELLLLREVEVLDAALEGEARLEHLFVQVVDLEVLSYESFHS